MGRKIALTTDRCQRARWSLSLALDGELDSLRERELEKHLRSCAACSLAAADFEAIAADPSRAFELFFQGKLQVSGDPALAGRLPALLGLLQAR